jgi:hypothetical protein
MKSSCLKISKLSCSQLLILFSSFSTTCFDCFILFNQLIWLFTIYNELLVTSCPLYNDPLYLGEQHLAYALFNHGLVDEKPLHVRWGDQKLWQHLKVNRIHHRVKQILDNAGFGGVVDCGYRLIECFNTRFGWKIASRNSYLSPNRWWGNSDIRRCQCYIGFTDRRWTGIRYRSLVQFSRAHWEVSTFVGIYTT